MTRRRDFLKRSVVGGAVLGSGLGVAACSGENSTTVQSTASPLAADREKNLPVVVSTWRNISANEAAWEVLNAGGNALDAAEAGVKIPEGDVNDRSVGYGGRPDRDGNVTLDACIMDHNSNCGSVAFLQHIKHPISVARAVMEKTPHVMLVGNGALQFALENGFERENLLTERSEKEWKEWLKDSEYKPVINIENHDTIGMLTIDKDGILGGACTTSGAAYKMQGRVGDSPIIGAGLFVDGDVGGATATGLGEAVIKVAGAHLVVEFMRQGMDPTEACKAAVERVIQKEPNYKDLQVGFLALNKYGEFGGYSIHPGYSFAIFDKQGSRAEDSRSALDKT